MKATERVDNGIQTDPCAQSNQLCQTDSPTSSEFQSQTNIPPENVSMTTQTDCLEMQDFQVQVNFEPANASIEYPRPLAIKTENITPTIPMPNIPNSVGQTSSKKRKLSSPRPAETSTQSDSMVTDPSILNSEVYKIYCQNEDPKEAMKQIKNMKTCFWFKEPSSPLPRKEVWRKSCEKILENLWSLENPAKSKWEQIHGFLTGDIDQWDLSEEDLPVTIDGKIEEHDCWSLAYNSFTQIQTLLPNGIEYWYVENFEGGVGVSKWYRGVSVDYHDRFGDKIVLLKMLGLEESTIEKYHYEFLKKKPVEITWLKFADTVVENESDNLVPDPPQNGYCFIKYDIQESKTSDIVVVNVSLQIRGHNYDDGSRRTIKSYHGNSTRPLKKRRPKNEKEEMTNEAKKAALMECFKDRFGFTEFNDISIDELHRPITA